MFRHGPNCLPYKSCNIRLDCYLLKNWILWMNSGLCSIFTPELDWMFCSTLFSLEPLSFHLNSLGMFLFLCCLGSSVSLDPQWSCVAPTALGYSRTSGSKVQESCSHSEPSPTRLYLKVALIPLLELVPESSSAPARFSFQDVLLQMDADSRSAPIPTDSRKLTSK